MVLILRLESRVFLLGISFFIYCGFVLVLFLLGFCGLIVFLVVSWPWWGFRCLSRLSWMLVRLRDLFGGLLGLFRGFGGFQWVFVDFWCVFVGISCLQCFSIISLVSPSFPLDFSVCFVVSSCFIGFSWVFRVMLWIFMGFGVLVRFGGFLVEC